MSANPKLFHRGDGDDALDFRTEVTLRDLFALAALNGFCSTKLDAAELLLIGSGRDLCEKFSANAYTLADAMLAERSKK